VQYRGIGGPPPPPLRKAPGVVGEVDDGPNVHGYLFSQMEGGMIRDLWGFAPPVTRVVQPSFSVRFLESVGTRVSSTYPTEADPGAD
jgi:hypothetical protein